MKLTKIERRFQDVALIRGAVFLLRPADAVRFVEECRQAGVRISGIEGFLVAGQRIQPLQDHSVDYCQSDAGNHADSATFLTSRQSDDVWFEVVTDDRETY